MDNPAQLRRQRLTGIILMCCAVAMFACLDTMAKYLSAELDTLQIAWARYAVALAVTVLAFNPLKLPAVARTRRPWFQLVRGVLLIGATVGNFLALRYMQLDEVLSIIFTFPFIVAIAAIPLLGERIGWRRWSAIGFGFAGVLLITRPGLGGVQLAALFSLGATISYGFYAVLTRIAARTDSNQTSLFYNNAVGTVALLPIMPFIWETTRSWFAGLLLLAIGVLGAVGHFCLIAGHRLAPASVLSPFVYTQLIWVTILGYLVFDHVPTAWTMGGAAMVISSGLYLLHRERKLGRTTTSEGVVEGPLE